MFLFRQTKTKYNKIRIFSLFEILECCAIMAMVNKKKFNNIIEKELPISIVLFLISGDEFNSSLFVNQKRN